MSSVPTYLACDLGAESGRCILGSLREGRLELEEIHRFVKKCCKKSTSELMSVTKTLYALLFAAKGISLGACARFVVVVVLDLSSSLHLRRGSYCMSGLSYLFCC